MMLFGLNDDVIHEIFYAFIAIDDEGPFTLIQVSTEWRSLVLNSPSLWTFISVDDLKSDWEYRLAFSLALSKKLPLKVQLYMPFIPTTITSLRPCVHRWEHLRIELRERWSVDNQDAVLHIHTSLQTLLGSPPPPSLKSVAWPTHDMRLVCNPDGVVSVSHLFSGVILPSPFNTAAEKSSLVTVHIVDTPLAIQQSQAGGFNVAFSVIEHISAFSFLKSLALFVRLLRCDFSSVGDIFFLHLQSLDLRALIHGPHTITSSLFGCLITPNLQTLSVYSNLKDLSASFEYIRPERFPRLTSLHLSTNKTLFDHTGPIICHPCPTIKALSVIAETTLAAGYIQAVTSMARNAEKVTIRVPEAEMPLIFFKRALDFKNLSFLERNGKEWPYQFNTSNVQAILNNLRSLTIDISASNLSRLRYEDLRCQNLEKLNLCGLGPRHHIEVFHVPQTPKLTSLDLGDGRIIIGKIELYGSGAFNCLRALRCSEAVAADIYPRLAPNLSTLTFTFLPAQGSGTNVFNDSKFIRAIAESRTLSSIEFSGRFWTKGTIDKSYLDINIFLYEKLLVSESINDNSGCVLSKAVQNLSISTWGYPNWSILLKTIKAIYSNPNTYSSPIQSIRVPALPHPTVLYPVVRALNGDFSSSLPPSN